MCIDASELARPIISFAASSVLATVTAGSEKSRQSSPQMTAIFSGSPRSPITSSRCSTCSGSVPASSTPIMSFASFAAAAIESSGARQSSQRMTLSFSLRPTRATEAAAPDLCAIFGARRRSRSERVCVGWE